MGPTWDVKTSTTERIFPATAPTERVVSLSLLDATTASFASTSALWLLEPPLIHFTGVITRISSVTADFSKLTGYLRHSLTVTLNSYPWWSGQLKSITSIDGTVEVEAARHLPPHARRFGRIYAHYGVAGQDPGIEFITATSSATLDVLAQEKPIWRRDGVALSQFVPSTRPASVLEPNEPVAGLRRPLVAVQVTQLACGGIAVVVKAAHPLADITSLVQFVKDWASVSRAALNSSTHEIEAVVFNPGLLDSKAAGDINADEPDAAIIRQAESLSMHRYDWWTTPGGPSWGIKVPEVFQQNTGALAPVGRPLPWEEWDLNTPVSSCIVHLSRAQVDFLWRQATKGQASPERTATRISKHDALLAHIWSCVVRARGLEQDPAPVHCDLTVGVRPVLKLGEAFTGSPIVMVNVEMAGSDVPAPENTSKIAHRIRETLVETIDRPNLAAHLHSVAYEKSPQRIWQGFLGRRHIMVTTWARAGIYEVDFGLGSGIRYADAVLNPMDGLVLIKEGKTPVSAGSSSWTDNGVDVTIYLLGEDMERLVVDPLLLPVT